MLQELLTEFINHQIQYPEFDVDTMVMENYRLKPGLYLRLNDDGGMDEFYLTEKTVLPENDSLVEWFKMADFASNIINTNKSIDPINMKIHSNNILTLFFKHKTLGVGMMKPEFKDYIDSHFNVFLDTRDKESEMILKTAGYRPLHAETVDKNKEKFFASLEAVKDRIKHNNIKDDSYIKLFLHVDLENYFSEGRRYLLPRIFNKKDYNIEFNGQLLGLSNTNMGMNAKKPYLEHKTTEFQVPYRITAEEGVLLYKMFLWLDGLAREGKPLYTGYFPIGKHEPGLFKTVNEIKIRKPAIYLHLDKGKNVTVDDYDFLPSFMDRMDTPLVFVNYLDVPKYLGGTQNKLSVVEAHINKYLYGDQLVRNYYVKKAQISANLPQALADQIMLSREVFHSWLRKGNDFPIKHSVDKVTMSVILARLQNMNYISTLAYALNVRLSLLNYFCEGEKDMGYKIEEAYIALKEKVLNNENKNKHVACENALEFYLAVGQVLYYYFSWSAAQKLHYDVLWRGIATAKSGEEIKKEHRKYFQKYAHAIDLDNVRFNRMLSIVTSYDATEKESVNLDALFFGFAVSNIIYFTDKNKENKVNERNKEEIQDEKK